MVTNKNIYEEFIISIKLLTFQAAEVLFDISKAYEDLTTAIRIAKDGAERSQNYHDSEAVRIEIQINKASDSTSNGLLLNEQEK